MELKTHGSGVLRYFGWFALAASTLSAPVGLACPSLHNTNEIQTQFQLLQHAASWIPDPQERELKELFQVNAESLEKFSCYYNKGDDPNALSDVLAVLKLQILTVRFAAFKKDRKVMADSLVALRKMSGVYLNQSSLIARRLGASVRSLLLDEMERLIDIYPDLVREEVRLGYWRSDLTSGIETEVQAQWKGVKLQLPASATPTSLARYFGYRTWVPPMAYRSRIARLLSHFKTESQESLETQLHSLFKMNRHNLELDETDRSVQHYLSSSIAELRKNNYFLLKPWLDPIIDEKVRTLKSELGVSWALISPLVGVAVEGSFRELGQPIELLDQLRLSQAKTHYARVRNPLGRLYEIVLLKRLTQMWTQIDVVQLRSDLNRVSFLKTLLAVQDYQKRFARWPSSVDDLVSKKMIQEVPRDYFTGKILRYDSVNRQIWSVGENGIDEKGRGDDLSLGLSL
jgi:hypothetical protein